MTPSPRMRTPDQWALEALLALQEYVQHKPGCASFPRQTFKCSSCGYVTVDEDEYRRAYNACKGYCWNARPFSDPNHCKAAFPCPTCQRLHYWGGNGAVSGDCSCGLARARAGAPVDGTIAHLLALHAEWKAASDAYGAAETPEQTKVACHRLDAARWDLLCWPKRRCRRCLSDAPGHDEGCPAQSSGAATEPASPAIYTAKLAATQSRCRSQRGAAIFWPNGHHVVANGHRVIAGFNNRPGCDQSDSCKATCRFHAVHAEEAAIMKCMAQGLDMTGAEMLHVKVVDGAIVPSGGPSCLPCSEMIVRAGLAGMWLYHKDGWRRYDAVEFHRLTIEARSSQIRSNTVRGSHG